MVQHMFTGFHETNVTSFFWISANTRFTKISFNERFMNLFTVYYWVSQVGSHDMLGFQKKTWFIICVLDGFHGTYDSHIFSGFHMVSGSHFYPLVANYFLFTNQLN